VIDGAPRPAGRPALVTLVRGDLRELDTLAAAGQLADGLRASLVAGVLPGRRSAGLDLLRSLAAGRVGRWYTWPELVAEASHGGVRALVASGETWRTRARAIWPALDRLPLLVLRRRPPSPPRDLLVAVDSGRTNAVLSRVVEQMPARSGRRLTVAYASVPPWACALMAAVGWPMTCDIAEARFPWPLAPGAAGVCVQATPRCAIQSLAAELRPDLVVLGVHPGRPGPPAIAHPTAWQLSRELPTDVLIHPVAG